MDSQPRVTAISKDELLLDIGQTGKLMMTDNSLTATMLNSEVRVNAPRSPVVTVELVDANRDPYAPNGAVYRICAHNPVNKSLIENGRQTYVYVGSNGIMMPKRI